MAIIFEKTNLGRYVLKIGDAENCLKNSKNAHTHAMAYVSLRLRKKTQFSKNGENEWCMTGFWLKTAAA